MYNQQYGQTALPVPHTQVDQNTFNYQLPNNNDRIPQVNMPKVFGANPQLAYVAIGLFRKKIQDSCQRTPVHIVAYNILSQGGFQNQFYQQWAQKAVDLSAIYMSRGGNPQQLLEQAVTLLSEAYLGAIWTAYKQALQQLVQPNVAQILEAAAGRFNEVENTIRAATQPQPQQYGNYQQPQQQYGGYQQQQQYNNYQQPQQMQGHNQFAQQANTVQGSTVSNHYQPMQTHVTTGTAPIANSMYDVPTQATPTPIQEISGGKIYDSRPGQHYNPTPIQPQAQPEYVEEEFVYIEPKDVVIDPTHYNTNLDYDTERPFDLIKLPGGIKVYPAFKHPERKLTHGSDNPYSLLYDPKLYCEFFIEYVDGVIKSKLKEWEDNMDYLKHELNDELRRRYRKPSDGIIAVSDTPIAKITDGVTRDVDAVKIAANLLTTEKLNIADGLPTLILDDTITYGTSDQDNEEAIKQLIREKAKSDIFDDVLPVHEYVTGKTYGMELSELMVEKLDSMLTYKTYGLAAATLKEHLRNRDLSLRNFNFINERLTANVNEFLKDSLSNDLTIDDFCGDIEDLLIYLEENRSEKIYTAFLESVPKVMYRSILIDDIGDGHAIADRFVNLQTAWSLSDLVVTEFKKGELKLLTNRSDKVLLTAIRGLLERNRERYPLARMRLITIDGVYLEIVKGCLIEHATLIKRL